MTQPPNSHEHSLPRPNLTIDWEHYAAMLEDSDMPLDQQRELVETLWSIVVMFVDMGFDLDPVAQICGEENDALSNDPPDIVSLIDKELRDQRQQEEDTWQN